MQGDSYLQIFENPTPCAFPDQITDILRLQNLDQHLWRVFKSARTGSRSKARKLGKVVGKDDDVSQKGCHDETGTVLSSNVTIPSSIRGCNDNLACGGVWSFLSFHYIFRGNYYENT
jgi:hypothetical protein